MTGTFRRGLWCLADPKISLASFSALALGTLYCTSRNEYAWGWLAVAVLASFAIEVAKNASGEIFDYRSGTDAAVSESDRSPFSGGKRVLVDGLLTRKQTWAIALAGYLVAIVLGLVIVLIREPRVAWLGLAGVALAYFYHAPPLKLSYRGLGEAAVGIAYGPGIVIGTVLVIMRAWRWDAVLISVPLGILIAAFLWINEFPDANADRACGKQTMVVRLGRRVASRWFAGLAIAAMLATLCLPLLGISRCALLGLLGFAPIARATRTLMAHPEDTAAIVPAQAQTLLSFVLYAILTGVGLLLG
jgi:1,4-dihydroxy-2-naphthoate octaprenyltransferase